MIKNCQGLNKSNWGLNAAMKQNCYMTYALEDCEKEISKALPYTISEEFFAKLEIKPSEAAMDKAEIFFKDLLKTQVGNLNVMRKALFHERQLYHVCQRKDMEYMKTYVGNQLLTDESTKRMAFYDKIQNTKENKDKQTANQGKSAKNAAAAEFRKKNQGNGGNQQKGQQGGGQQQQQQQKHWVQPWANNNSNQSNYQGQNNGGNRGNKFNKSFSPKNCPKCLEPHHRNSP
jgi:hypothetical protein